MHWKLCLLKALLQSSLLEDCFPPPHQEKCPQWQCSICKDWNYTPYNGRWQDHYTVCPNAITSSILNNTEFKDSLMRTQVLIPLEKVKPEPRFDSTQMKWRWHILFSPLTGGCRLSWSKDRTYIHRPKTRFHFPYYPCPIYMPRLHNFARSCKLLNSAKSC